jgi:neutral ceramidase
MKIPKLLCLTGVLIVLLSVVASAPPADKVEWKAGAAVVDITPADPLWMAGYAARKGPSQGTAQPLHAKALALEDRWSHRCVIITSDLLGFPAAVSEPIAEQVRRRYGLERDQLVFTSSHTHSGPVIRESLINMYPLDPAQADAVRAYTAHLQSQIEELVGAALKDLAPARLSLGRIEADFAVNRRLKKDGQFIIGVNREGPVDREVTILRVERADGGLRALLFSYACHNTTLTQDNYQFHGDYAGVAQEVLEKEFPGTTALFMLGCAADANPDPRGAMQLVRVHGEALARRVRYALSDPMRTIRGPLRTLFDRVDLPFAAPPSREELQARLQSADVYVRKHAQCLLATLDQKGSLPASYPYPIGIVRFGNDLTLVALSGEVVVDYAIRLKKELGPSAKLWVAAYANDVFAYIPSRRVLTEGGYEPVTSMTYYGLPGPWAPEVEDILVNKVRQMVKAAR